jgi:hypothetical protein
MLTRVYHAQDWGSGIELSNLLLGKLNKLQLHHIFPKALLHKHHYSRADVNALANYAFLTQDTNLQITDRPPAEYLPEFAAKHPGVLESHWIPMEPDLWKIERYQDFLAARRELLAKAANAFLDSLLAGTMPEVKVTPPAWDTGSPGSAPAAPILVVPSAKDPDEEAVEECDAWVTARGLPKGEYMYELLDPTTNEVRAVLDLAWPNGLQEGLSQPVAFVPETDEAMEQAMNKAGYRFFTRLVDFQHYVGQEILALSA